MNKNYDKILNYLLKDICRCIQRYMYAEDELSKVFLFQLLLFIKNIPWEIIEKNAKDILIASSLENVKNQWLELQEGKLMENKEMIHELIFDFVNGKTKSFKFDTEDEAQKIITEFETARWAQTGRSNFFVNIEKTTIFALYVCSITYNSYPKPEEK